MKEITLSALFVPFLFPTCGTNWTIICSSVSELREANRSQASQAATLLALKNKMRKTILLYSTVYIQSKYHPEGC